MKPSNVGSLRPIAQFAIALALLCSWSRAAEPLIPRKTLFGNPDHADVQISPDGAHISFLAPVNGVLNVWVAPYDDPAGAKPVSHDSSRPIRTHFWSYGRNQLLYLQDQDGNENFNLFCVNLDSGETKNLTPNKSVQVHVEAVSPRVPNAVLVGLNDRDPRFHDLHRIDLLTRSRGHARPPKNSGTINGDTVGGFVVDDEFHLRFFSATTADGSVNYYRPLNPPIGGQKTDWQQADHVPGEDALTTSPLDFSKDGRLLYFTDSRDRDTAALVSFDTLTGEKTLIFADPRVDIGTTLVHPTDTTIQAVALNYDRQTWKVLDPSIAPDLDYLKTVAPGDFNITAVRAASTITAGRLIAYVMDDGPVRFYQATDRKTKQATFLFSNRRELEGLKLAKMHPLVIQSRDGMNMVSYLTLPPPHDRTPDSQGAAPRTDAPLPLVLFVHGGPWGRDVWGLNSIHQWLANRGYAVLSVNFRGSTGFGKGFTNAGNPRVGRQNARRPGGCSPLGRRAKSRRQGQDRNYQGGSYGGYATLTGLTFTPDLFACGVDVVGPTRLVTLLHSIPPYWTAIASTFKARVGDVSTDEGRRFLDSRSPLSFVDRIKRPLLIGQGKNDPRVKQAEADQIVNAMKQKHLPVTYVLYPDEGHGFARPENNLSFMAVAEQFLARHLGGVAEPIGDDFHNSSIAVLSGADQVPGVAEALKRQ